MPGTAKTQELKNDLVAGVGAAIVPNERRAEFTDTAGRPVEAPSGPRGARMFQLGILTKAQKRKPILPKIRTGIDGKPNPEDLENAKFQSTLQEKYQERLASAQAAGPTNTLTESNPMMRSYFARAAMKVGR